jgi:membrane protein DedA with SNARE-associated domain
MEYFFSIFLGTFVLEDAAIASSIALIAQHKIGFMAAYFACFLGIGLGDLGIYLIGYGAYHFKTFYFLRKHFASLTQIKNSRALTFTIIISRMVFGLRLPTYLVAGYTGFSLWRFFLLTVSTVSLWVLMTLSSGQILSHYLKGHWILIIFSFLIILKLLKSFIPKLIDPWSRRALLYTWQKWLHFEFWPAWLFYIPIIPRYIFLSIKYKSLLIPFYVNPQILNGGLIGESKWDFLRHLNPLEKSTLKSIKIDKSFDFLGVKNLLRTEGISFPFIMKPDVGQRGFGVRIIRDDSTLSEYLNARDFKVIIQELSQFSNEAGLFYVREPSQSTGRIFSITDKKFPFIVGDGISKFGMLILKDPRARIIAPIYFERFKDRLDSVLAKGEVVILAECGNHCQGAIFLNGRKLISDELTRKLDHIAKQIPDFFFGRFDVRYLDQKALMQGQCFEIVEVNGSGSEATHIWDADTKLVEAYRTLYDQWGLLFEIGHQVKASNRQKVRIDLLRFLKECFSVATRKVPFSVSS